MLQQVAHESYRPFFHGNTAENNDINKDYCVSGKIIIGIHFSCAFPDTACQKWLPCKRSEASTVVSILLVLILI